MTNYLPSKGTLSVWAGEEAKDLYSVGIGDTEDLIADLQQALKTTAAEFAGEPAGLS